MTTAKIILSTNCVLHDTSKTLFVVVVVVDVVVVIYTSLSSCRMVCLIVLLVLSSISGQVCYNNCKPLLFKLFPI